MSKKIVNKINPIKKVVAPKSHKSTITKEIIKWLKHVAWEETPKEREDGKGSITYFSFSIQNEIKLNCMIITEEDENEIFSLVASPEFVIPENKIADVTDFCFHFRKDHGNLYINDKGEINYINSRSIDSFNNGLDDVGVEIQNMIDEMNDYLKRLISPIEDIANATINLKKALKLLEKDKFFHEETKSIEEEVADIKTKLSDQDFESIDKSSAATADIYSKKRIKKSRSNADEVATKKRGIKMSKNKSKENKMLDLIEKYADEVGLEKNIEVTDNGDVTFNATFTMEIEGYKEELPFILYIECSNDPLYVLGYLYIESDEFAIPANKLSKTLEVVNEINLKGITGRFAITGGKFFQYKVSYDLNSLNLQDCPVSLIHQLVYESQSSFSENFNELTKFVSDVR